MHSLVTLLTFGLGLAGTAVALRALAASTIRPRPFYVTGSVGSATAFLLSAYAGAFAGKVLNLDPPEWLITAATVAVFILTPPAFGGVITSIVRRRRNVLYRRAFWLTIGFLLLASGLPLVPRTPLQTIPAPAPQPAIQRAAAAPSHARDSA
jgi:hypothetical protein